MNETNDLNAAAEKLAFDLSGMISNMELAGIMARERNRIQIFKINEVGREVAVVGGADYLLLGYAIGGTIGGAIDTTKIEGPKVKDR